MTEYQEGVVENTSDGVAQHALSQQRINVPGFGYIKDSSVIRKIPWVAPLFITADFMGGYRNPPRELRNDGLVEKTSSGVASAASGITFGLVPERESAIGLARMFTGGHYGKIPVPTKEELIRAAAIQKLHDEAMRQPRPTKEELIEARKFLKQLNKAND